jgi:nucleoside-diphosphate-sugar epimerase
MRLLVTGATGYIGSVVAEVLKSGGHEVFGLARSEEAAKRLSAAGHQVRAGALEDLDSLPRALNGIDAVLYCAAGYQADAAAIDAMLPAMKGRPLLYTSGVWVFGDTRGRMLGEIGALNPPPLVAWRPAVEQRVIEAGGMVFRPGMVFGRKGGVFRMWFDSAAKDRIVRVVGLGDNHWSNVHVDDLADLYKRAIEEPAPGELFIACGGMPQVVRKLAEAAAHSAGPDVRVEFVPVEKAREDMGPLADCLAMDCKAGSTKSARFFGWRVMHPDIIGELESGTYL